MAFQLSPGVQVTEKDLTSVVPAVGTSIGGTAGVFSWGPANVPVSISSENELVSRFGKPPAAGSERSWMAAASFLAYTSTLKVVRAINAASKNATSGVDDAAATGALIKNEDDYETNFSSGGSADGMFAAKWAGAIGNSLKVSFADASDYATWAYKAQFDYAPTATKSTTAVGGSVDEMHIIVIDEDGLFTGNAGTVLEKFAGVSKASDAKDSTGRSNYYKEVLNQRSQYIWWTSHPAASNNWGNQASGLTFNSTHTADESTTSLGAGADGVISDADKQAAFLLFANDELVDVNLVFVGDASAAVGDYVIDNIAEVRKDCMVFVSPAYASVIDNAGSEATDIVAEVASYTRSSYAVFDSGWKYMYNRYTDGYAWVPCNGDVAGLCAQTDDTADPWFSPAGYNRGAIKNAIKMAYSPNKTDRDALYQAGVNPIVGFPGSGIVLFGDKTLLEQPSAFDRINVRRLFITLEKAIATAAKFQLFEFNDAFTRAQFKNLVEPFLRDVQGRRGVYDFRVVCDDTNNTSTVIDANSFVADIFIQPAKSINFIQLNFVATRTGVQFEEVGA
jgi:phage tail sheath protein FI